MREEKALFKFSEVLIIVFITSFFSIFAGISYGKVKYSNTVSINGLSSDEDEALNEFVKEFKYITTNYYDKSKINEEELLKVALQSIFDVLGIDDIHSTYMDNDDYNQLNINLNGEYEGLGISAYKEKEDGEIIVVTVFKNSAAEKAGIKEDDKIISIDGKSAKEMTVSEFSNYVLKSEKKDFELEIIRDKQKKKIKLEKSVVELESVSSKIIEKDGNKIGYITMSIFAANSYEQFEKKLNEIEKEGFDSLIIDLRSNTGGHLTEVTNIISLFLDKKKVIYQLQKNEDKVKYYSVGKEDKKYPIVFLSNELTASASEVFIISLKENLGAKVVGKKTYGKGTVQELVSLKNGDKYKLTVKKWLSPKGNWINDTKGIEPDIEVKLSAEYINNPIEKNDNQLEEAIKLSIKLIEENK